MERELKYDNYDYEEAYKEQIEKLEEWELERLLKEEKVSCLYRTTTIKSKNKKSGKEFIETNIYPSYNRKKDMPRTKRKRESKPSQKNLNDKNARRYLIRLVNINFAEGDYWCTFGWNEGELPEDWRSAQKDIQRYIDRIRYRQGKRSREKIKYIYILAFDGYARPHFHLIISTALTRDELEDVWGKCDRPNTRRIKPDNKEMLVGMATYITQNPHRKKRWCPSKNLDKPGKPTRSYRKFSKKKAERMVKDYEVMKEELEKAYPGYQLQEADARYNGINAAFYIYARMVRD